MTVRARSEVDPVFETQIRALRASCDRLARAILEGGRSRWMLPDLLGWSGDLTDLEGMAKPFSREAANRQFVDAIADPANPGTTADLIATTTQIDYLACLERAFRNRYATPRNRAMLHAAGRLAGQAHESGVLTVCCLEYVRRLVRQAKGEISETAADTTETTETTTEGQ